jgi:hypothetical protein
VQFTDDQVQIDKISGHGHEIITFVWSIDQLIIGLQLNNLFKFLSAERNCHRPNQSSPSNPYPPDCRQVLWIIFGGRHINSHA